jgi:hypothetical protein
MSWAAIRDAFKTAIDAAELGLVVHDVATDTLPDKKGVVEIIPGEPLYLDAGHAGKVDVNVICRVTCVWATVKDSQDKLDQYLWPSGEKSIHHAVLADYTLGGIADDVRFLGVGSYGRPIGENNIVTTGAAADVRFLVKANGT